MTLPTPEQVREAVEYWSVDTNKVNRKDRWDDYIIYVFDIARAYSEHKLVEAKEVLDLLEKARPMNEEIANLNKWLKERDDNIDKARDEIARLREALEKIVDTDIIGDKSCRKIAFKVLKGK